MRMNGSAELAGRVVWLLAAAMLINYVDRGALATAAPVLKDALHFSNAQMGVLLSAFFWTYAPAQPFAGWLAQRADVRWVLAIGVALWSAATLLTSLATGFLGILLLRLLLGLGESVVFPCNAVLLARGAPETRRGRANGIITGGLALGPAVGTLGGGLLLAQFGWRMVFLACGALSLLWLLPWLGTRIEAAHRTASGSAPAPAFSEILATRAIWGASLGHFSSTYAMYFMLSWLPLYLVKAHGFTVPQMAWIGAGIYALVALGAASFGRLSDAWIARGASATRVRKSCLIAGLAGVSLCMLSCTRAGSMLSVVLLALAGPCIGLQSPMVFAVGQTLAGPRAAGRWMGVQNFLGNLSGIIAPLATGLIVERTGSFDWAFIVAAAVCGAGILGWALIVGRVQEVPWQVEAAPVPG